MSTISYKERFTHPTTADVEAVLDMSHCTFCEFVSQPGRMWRDHPNSGLGRRQLDQIGAHFRNHNIGKDKFDG